MGGEGHRDFFPLPPSVIRVKRSVPLIPCWSPLLFFAYRAAGVRIPLFDAIEVRKGEVPPCGRPNVAHLFFCYEEVRADPLFPQGSSEARPFFSGLPPIRTKVGHPSFRFGPSVQLSFTPLMSFVPFPHEISVLPLRRFPFHWD